MEGKGPAMAALLGERRIDPEEVSAAASAISAGTETVLGLVERLGPLLTHTEVGTNSATGVIWIHFLHQRPLLKYQLVSIVTW